MDEAQLRAVTIGDLTPHATKIVIEDYNPAWPDWYASDRDRIAAALGPAALSIEHAGSTSVELEEAGYTLRGREPEWYEHRVLQRKAKPHDVNVHVFSPQHAGEEIARMLTFRDWLRTHEDDKTLYATTKRELSTRDWRYVQDYADAKTQVVKQILARAQP